MKKYIIVTITILISVLSCTNDFEETNANPNQPEQVSSDLLLSTVISTVANRAAQSGWDRGNIVGQLTAKINFTGFDRYEWGSESGLWNEYYEILPEIDLILKASLQEETKNTSYEGMALILKSYVFSILTDNWGNIPFSEAIDGQNKNFTPKYDNQQDIYTAILLDLKKAEQQLAVGQPILGGDILYGGDLEKWRKLANSLRLRYLLRISNKVDVSSEMKEIVDSGIFIAANADNAAVSYPATTQIDSWPISTGRIGGFDEHRLSETSEAILKQFNDQRLSKWFQPTDNPDDDPTLFVGLTNGLSEDNASTFNGGASNVSRINQSFFYDSPNSVKAVIIQAAEVHFILAEAAQRGWITTDAKTSYENGVRLSFEYWEVNQDVTAYLAQTGVVYDDTLETIITQKWLASFLVGFEAWYDFRRTGLPSVIIPGPDNVNGDRIPVRFLYPDSEQTLNNENYEQATSQMGGNDINIKGWWEN
ncbi:SusD-like starch-binding protein associating with outer membrane [Aquimarina sp. MAR_2010_214]|uniref:SusD/RagB family nutrient-binding outer membrane lipoprotein n=1 Tax=Aquimarina sp. MAR_2010_214 TaxID=1250026 RepID=UPI000C702964|nr:SusD/RagB family nutrient-binding outer membrane lipoprotein [Aquimarina sp. MAR_2010_214]PKV53051.1 SusD-like starch-binding protein associating with outer membrane [Aquimarina sp. MAR_2010_214]